MLANLERRLRRVRAAAARAGAHAADEDFEAVYDEFHRYMTQTVVRGVRRHAPAQGGALRQGRRQEHHRDDRADHPRGARLLRRARRCRRAQKEIAGRILREVGDRLSFLVNVGLDYLSLDRTAATLSGGEAQRIRLATQIGSSLVGVLYILDEPSIGLHQRDNARLLETLTRLRDLGNTVLVVEHDEETIRAADHVIDMGPRAGVHGGRIVAAGTPEDIAGNTHSLTGAYLSGRKQIEVPRQRRQSGNRTLDRQARARRTTCAT